MSDVHHWFDWSLTSLVAPGFASQAAAACSADVGVLKVQLTLKCLGAVGETWVGVLSDTVHKVRAENKLRRLTDKSQST